MNPVKKAVVKVVVKRGAKETLSRIDTPEERQQIVKSIKLQGLPPWASWAVALLVPLLLEAVSEVGFDLLVAGDAQAWGMLLARTFAAKALLMMNEGQDVNIEEEKEEKNS
jgi:hypothetical protein